MERLKDADSEEHDRDENLIVDIEIEIEGEVEPRALCAPHVDPEHVRAVLEIEAEVHLFERDQDLPFTSPIHGRKAIRLVAHRAHLIEVEVRYEHHERKRAFAPAKTVFRVLQWAVGKEGFNLDATAAARANLILPGAETPLPREGVIGAYTQPGCHTLVLDLTLRDFTNG